jgi:hypothetical protein
MDYPWKSIVSFQSSQENGKNHSVGHVVGVAVLQGTDPLSKQPWTRFPIIVLRNTRAAES